MGASWARAPLINNSLARPMHAQASSLTATMAQLNKKKDSRSTTLWDTYSTSIVIHTAMLKNTAINANTCMDEIILLG